MKLMKTQEKNTQISVYCIKHYCIWSFGIIKQLLPALAVNIIIVHPRVLFILSAGNNCIMLHLVRDSSAVRRLFVRLAGAVGRQSVLHKEISGFAAPTPGRHISTFRGYQILFSIRNPYINRFTNHFSIRS